MKYEKPWEGGGGGGVMALSPNPHSRLYPPVPRSIIFFRLIGKHVFLHYFKV